MADIRVVEPVAEPLYEVQDRMHASCAPQGGGIEYAIARPAATMQIQSTSDTIAAIFAPRGVSLLRSHWPTVPRTVTLKTKTLRPASTSMIIFSLKKMLL